MGEYIGTGTDVPLELTRAGQVQNTIGNVKGGIQDLMGKIGGLGPVSFLMNKMDRFGSLSPTDQEFIKMNMGYTGPTVFGENNSGLGKDMYGINTRSMFGNYGEYVDKMVAGYEDMTEDDYENLSKFNKAKVDFYRDKKIERKDYEWFEQYYSQWVPNNYSIDLVLIANSRKEIIDQYGLKYKDDKDLLNDFYSYWTEHNEKGKKMRFEMSKNQPFNIKRRLVTFLKNRNKWKGQNKKPVYMANRQTEQEVKTTYNNLAAASQEILKSMQ